MGKLTVALVYEDETQSSALVESLLASPVVEEVLTVGGIPRMPNARVRALTLDSFLGAGIVSVLDRTTTDYLLLILPGHHVKLGPRALERLLSVAEDFAPGLVYSDFRHEAGKAVIDHPLIDYQLGSIRDCFDFGSMVLISKRAAGLAIHKYGAISERLQWAGFYDLRLKLSIDAGIMRIPEPIYTRVSAERGGHGARRFDYVNPCNRDYQLEMEQVATEHLKRIGAYLAPEFKPLPRSVERFPVRASIVIPVRDRQSTIKEAVLSGLNQKTSFDFNVIVVDTSTADRTTKIIARMERKHSRLIHIRPGRSDLWTGGSWNEAIYSRHCGEYAVQLDSDDMYSDDLALEKIVTEFEQGQYAMVVGAYTLVDFYIRKIPPGLVDHREWTRANGRNNALRIHGLGAPRAYYTPVIRQIGFPNTCYGEDYSIALRISRHYEIGRIYESVYLARRWKGNSDALLSIPTANRYHAYKDYLRTIEIAARKGMNQQTREQSMGIRDELNPVIDICSGSVSTTTGPQIELEERPYTV